MIVRIAAPLNDELASHSACFLFKCTNHPIQVALIKRIGHSEAGPSQIAAIDRQFPDAFVTGRHLQHVLDMLRGYHGRLRQTRKVDDAHRMAATTNDNDGNEGHPAAIRFQY